MLPSEALWGLVGSEVSLGASSVALGCGLAGERVAGRADGAGRGAVGLHCPQSPDSHLATWADPTSARCAVRALSQVQAATICFFVLSVLSRSLQTVALVSYFS